MALDQYTQADSLTRFGDTNPSPITRTRSWRRRGKSCGTLPH
ncbi:hypothetical protein NKH77_40135 [Streptomyces sp. M19]